MIKGPRRASLVNGGIFLSVFNEKGSSETKPLERRGCVCWGDNSDKTDAGFYPPSFMGPSLALPTYFTLRTLLTPFLLLQPIPRFSTSYPLSISFPSFYSLPFPYFPQVYIPSTFSFLYEHCPVFSEIPPMSFARSSPSILHVYFW